MKFLTLCALVCLFEVIHGKVVYVKQNDKISGCFENPKKADAYILILSVEEGSISGEYKYVVELKKTYKKTLDTTVTLSEDLGKLCFEKSELAKSRSYKFEARDSIYSIIYSETIQFKIYEPPKVSNELSEKVVISRNTPSRELKCSGSGSPNLSAVWLTNDGKELSSSDILKMTIEDFEEDNEKKFICQVSIEGVEGVKSTTDEKTVTVVHHYLPIITTNTKLYTAINDTAVIELKIDSNPAVFSVQCFEAAGATMKINTIKPGELYRVEFKVENKNTKLNCYVENSVGESIADVNSYAYPIDMIMKSGAKSKYSNYYVMEVTLHSKSELKSVKINLVSEKDTRKIEFTKDAKLSEITKLREESSSPSLRIIKVRLENLIAATDYSAEMTVCNAQNHCSTTKNFKFTTAKGTPANQVPDSVRTMALFVPVTTQSAFIPLANWILIGLSLQVAIIWRRNIC